MCARALSERANNRGLVVGVDTVCSGECFPTFQMNVVSLSLRVFGTVFAGIWRLHLRSKRRYPFTRGHSAVRTTNLASILYFSKPKCSGLSDDDVMCSLCGMYEYLSVIEMNVITWLGQPAFFFSYFFSPPFPQYTSDTIFPFPSVLCTFR